MKKVILIFAAMFIFASCKKCLTCTETTTTTPIPITYSSGGVTHTERYFDACGDYLRSINGQVTTYQEVRGLLMVKITTKTECY